MIVTRRHVGPPCRFESAVRALLGDASRRLTRQLIDSGAATVNGSPARKGATVHVGDELAVPILPLLGSEPTLPVGVVAVDDDLLVLDKPAPMPTVPLDPRERGTLAGFVVGHWPACRRVGEPLETGIAHRLDTGSSGLVLATPDARLWHALRRAFGARLIRKDYVAIVVAPPPRGTIRMPLAHDARDSRRMTTDTGRGRRWSAETDVTAVDRFGVHWMVRVTIRTGVTHQVRAHLASVGAPVLGDTLYGGPAHPMLLGRHALHATSIAVPPLAEHGGGRWHSPLPPSLQALA